MSAEVADILDGAADVIERDGWHQGYYFTAPLSHPDPGSGPVCTIGALCRASGRAPWHVEEGVETQRLIEVIGASSVSAWNDAPARTEQEVLDALRLAAKQERMGGDPA